MSLREKIEQNPTVAAIGAVAVLVIAIVVIAMQYMGGDITGGGSGQAYFLDTGSGKLFRAASSERAPIKAPSGKDGVRAYIYSCGECLSDYDGMDKAALESNEAFVGYVERLNPKAKKALEKAQASGGDTMAIEMQISMTGVQYSNAAAKKWVGANSEAGFQVMNMARQRCTDAKVCVAK